jgi:hypothetical protein
MPDYLFQDLMNPRGYVARQSKPKTTEAAVALTADGQVVFGDPKTARSLYAKSTSKLMYYDDEVERQRRLACDTALGQLMLDNPKYALPAVNAVSQGILLYWRGLATRLCGTDGFKKITETDGKYVSNATSFGRLPQAKPKESEVNQFKAKIEIWLTSLSGGDLPQIMNLHDTFLKVYCSNEPGKGKPMDLATRFGFRQDWYEGDSRGRANRPTGSYSQSEMPGLITGDFTIPVWQALERSGVNYSQMRVEKRNRGTDMFMIAARQMKPEFRQILGESNLVFAASASGTTSTLLTSANVFCPGVITNAESKKQYLMGCVAYLIGGGMHTCHEVFYTGGIAGLTYTPGKYISMLPQTFLSSRLYERWTAEFWEIVRPDRPSPR